MKILVIGGGGREHAVIWKLKQSKRETEIYCAPGNGGIASLAANVPIAATDIEGVVDFSVKNAIDLVIVTPDDPLALGMVEVCPLPTVLKADGLALGKGVLICETREQAREALDKIMKDKAFGSAGDTLVVEEFMEGPEVSVLTFCDGKTLRPMASAQDHKRALDNDKGTNTGGMGTFSPTPKYTPEVQKYVEEKIFAPTVDALIKEGRPFKGVIFFGLMLTKDGPKVLEYNARFGDPEAQSVLFRMENDLLDVIDAVIDGKLDEVELKFSDDAAVCVVMASGGYPGSYEKGKEITGLEDIDPDVMVFHAGTKLDGGKLVTSGGRVLGVTAKGATMEEARKKAYANVEKIKFEGAHYRKDIGIKK